MSRKELYDKLSSIYFDAYKDGYYDCTDNFKEILNKLYTLTKDDSTDYQLGFNFGILSAYKYMTDKLNEDKNSEVKLK